MRGRLALCLVAIAVVAASAAVAYLWPPNSTGLTHAPPEVAPIDLPREPESIAADVLRAEAERGAVELTERYPRSAAAHRTAATLYQFLKQYDLATRHWEACLALDENSGEARVSLATVHLLVGRDREARELLQAAFDSGARTPELYRQLSEALARTGELDEAERVALDGTRQFPERADLWIAAAQLELQRNQLERAKTSIDAALAIEPKSSKALFLAANICTRLGKNSEAEAHRRELARFHSAADRDRLPFEEEYVHTLRSAVTLLFTAMALEYRAQGDSARAEHWCRRAIALDPQSLEAHRLLVGLFRSGGQIPNAFLAQRRLLELEPASVVNYINFASLALSLGRRDEGEEALSEAARMAPQNSLVRRMLAAIYLERQQLDKARAAAEQAVALEPGHDNYLLLANICGLQGDRAAEDAAFQAAERLRGDAAP